MDGPTPDSSAREPFSLSLLAPQAAQPPWCVDRSAGQGRDHPTLEGVRAPPHDAGTAHGPAANGRSSVLRGRRGHSRCGGQRRRRDPPCLYLTLRGPTRARVEVMVRALTGRAEELSLYVWRRARAAASSTATISLGMSRSLSALDPIVRWLRSWRDSPRSTYPFPSSHPCRRCPDRVQCAHALVRGARALGREAQATGQPPWIWSGRTGRWIASLKSAGDGPCRDSGREGPVAVAELSVDSRSPPSC